MIARESLRIGAGVAALLLLIPACGPKYVNRNDLRPAPEVRPAPTSSETFPRLFLDQVATPTVLHRGEVLTIEVRFLNDGSSPVFLPAAEEVFGFRLQEDNGRVVAPRRPAAVSRSSYPGQGVMLEPGATGTVVFFWVYDDPSLPPGEYFLFSGFGAWGEVATADWVRIVLR